MHDLTMRFEVLIVLVMMFATFSEGSSVLAYWSLNGSEPGLTLHGGPSFVEGHYPGSKAINFNQPSNCFARIPKVELRGRSFTIALWVKVKSLLNRDQAVFSDWYHPWQFFVNVDRTGAIHFVRHSSDASWYSASMMSTSKIDAGKWYHIAVTWDQSGGVSKLYIDAKENNSIAIDKSKVWIGATRDTYEIGDDGHWQEHQFLGSVMDLYIIDGVLDSDEISHLKGCQILSKPTNLIASYDMQSRSLTLSWKRPLQDCNNSQLNYTVYYNVQGERVFQTVEVVRKTKVRLSLRPNKIYKMFVMAKNKNGYGPLSRKINVSTLQEGCHLPSKPTNLIASYDMQSRSLTLSWKRPLQDCNNSQLKYTVYYKEQSERVFQTVEVVRVTKVRLSVRPNEIYEMFVMAKNKNGYGPVSVKINASTLQKDERVPCNGDMPLTGYNGNDLYCGRGGVRCPYGSYCDIHPSDKYAKCCPQTVKKEVTSCISDWVKMNKRVVCFGANGSSFGSLHNSIKSGIVVAIKLEHAYGHVGCVTKRTRQNNWGCANADGKNSHLNVVITDQFNHIIFPKNQYIGAIWYQMPFVDVASSKELVFTDLANPFYFPKNKEMRIWYGEDLMGKGKDDNVGRACVNVYAKFMGG